MGFKGHLLTAKNGLIIDFTLTHANIDERDVLPELVIDKVKGIVIADKGLISSELKEELRQYNIDLQTALRSNMKDERPKSLIRSLMTIRRRIETTNYISVNREI